MILCVLGVLVFLLLKCFMHFFAIVCFVVHYSFVVACAFGVDVLCFQGVVAVACFAE